MSSELITLGDRLPPSLKSNNHFYGNSDYENLCDDVKEDIFELGSSMIGWKAEMCRRYAEGESQAAIAKDIGKSAKAISTAIRTDPDCQNLIQYWKCLKDLESGPSKSARRFALWQLYQDNKDINPKEARGALAELNKMDADQQNKGGGNINIVIDTSKLPKGNLDD